MKRVLSNFAKIALTGALFFSGCGESDEQKNLRQKQEEEQEAQRTAKYEANLKYCDDIYPQSEKPIQLTVIEERAGMELIPQYKTTSRTVTTEDNSGNMLYGYGYGYSPYTEKKQRTRRVDTTVKVGDKAVSTYVIVGQTEDGRIISINVLDKDSFKKEGIEALVEPGMQIAVKTGNLFKSGGLCYHDDNETYIGNDTQTCSKYATSIRVIPTAGQ